MSCERIAHELVEFIPESLADCTVYVSQKYETAVHKCACGCGEEVVTPLGPTDWSISISRRGVTLYPSIGNWSFACQSHYFIRDGAIEWALQMTPGQIARVRARDRAAKEAYFASSTGAQGADDMPVPVGLIRRLYKWLCGFWK